MSTVARFDLKMEPEEKDEIALAASIMGTSMSSFVRLAAKEKAQKLIENNSKIMMSGEDFQALNHALNNTFKPNSALTKALDAAKRVKRRV